jgi:transcriptional regulator with XRE-family HTH domain
MTYCGVMPTEQPERRPWHELTVLRRCAHLSQLDLAEALDCDPTYISHLSRGVREPNDAVFVRLAETLSVPVDLLRPGAVETVEFRARATELAQASWTRMSTGFADKLIADVRTAA